MNLPGQPEPHDLLLNRTLAALRSICPADRRWFVEVLLDELGFVYGISDAPDPVEAIREVGAGVPAALVAAVHLHAGRRTEAVAAARDVVAHIGAEVEAVAMEAR